MIGILNGSYKLLGNYHLLTYNVYCLYSVFVYHQHLRRYIFCYGIISFLPQRIYALPTEGLLLSSKVWYEYNQRIQST